ncbi:hypothetical protein Tco_0819225 [Tanacetum coccineum]|uniref:Uncharacterized protein n=1 Tax=Tanacetum coccineum TaxID=301880 RepID=A0ABQ5A5Y2_9ASTR
MDDFNPERSKESPTFQVVLEASCYSTLRLRATTYFSDHEGRCSESVVHTREIHSTSLIVLLIKMHQPWRTFAALINRSLSGTTTSLDKLSLSRAQILWGMYHQKNVAYVELLWEDFIYQIDNKAYKKQEKMYYPRFTKVIIHYFLTQDKTLSWRNKTGMHTSKDDYLINTLRFVSAKEATQIYGAILPESLKSPEIKETKAYKTYFGFATGARPPKKARKFKKPASPKLTNVPVSTKEPIGKSKRVKRPEKKSTQAPTKGVLLDVTEEESSESEAESWGNDEDDSNNEQDSSDEENDSNDDKAQLDNKNESDSELEKDENKLDSESDQEENKEDDEDDDEEEEEKVVKTLSNNFDDEDETKIADKAKGDEDEEMDYTTSQLYDDVDIRLNERVDTDKGLVQEEGTDAAMTNVQQGNENLEVSQVIEDAHVTLSTIPQKTEVLVSSSSHSSDLAAKFLNFSDIPTTEAEIVSPMDVHVHHEVPSKQTPTLFTVPVLVITDSSPIFSTILLEEVSNFSPPVIQKMVKESLEDAVLAKESSQPQSSYEDAATLTEFELKKILIDKMDKSESYLAVPEHRECYEGLKKSYDLNKTIFSIYGKVYSLKRI